MLSCIASPAASACSATTNPWPSSRLLGPLPARINLISFGGESRKIDRSCSIPRPISSQKSQIAIRRVAGGLLWESARKLKERANLGAGGGGGVCVGSFGGRGIWVRAGTVDMAGLGKLKKEEELQVYENVEELSVSLAAHVSDVANAAVDARGLFTVVLSGGSLIKTLGKLCESPYLESVQWAKWHVFWADERVVKKDHPDSNYKLAWDGFLCKVPIPSGQVYAIDDTLSVKDAAEDYEFHIKQLVKVGTIPTADIYPRFDLLLLGMGPDGHCCSLFPRHPLVQVRDKWIAPISDSPKPPPERITLTMPVVQAAANVTFVAIGEGKADMLAKVFGEELPLGELPSQSARPLDGKLIWFADKPAVSKL